MVCLSSMAKDLFTKSFLMYTFSGEASTVLTLPILNVVRSQKKELAPLKNPGAQFTNRLKPLNFVSSIQTLWNLRKSFV